MKTKVKNEKGITLVALIITIIVLVILATVAIATITNTGMIQYSIRGAQDYSDAQKDEENKLQNIQETMDEAIERGKIKKEVTVAVAKGDNVSSVTINGEEKTSGIFKTGDIVTIEAVVNEKEDTEVITRNGETLTGTTYQVGDIKTTTNYTYSFNWKENDTSVSEDKTYTFTVGNDDITLTAVDEENSTSSTETWTKIQDAVDEYEEMPDSVFALWYVGSNSYTGWLSNSSTFQSVTGGQLRYSKNEALVYCNFTSNHTPPCIYLNEGSGRGGGGNLGPVYYYECSPRGVYYRIG